MAVVESGGFIDDSDLHVYSFVIFVSCSVTKLPQFSLQY